MHSVPISRVATPTHSPAHGLAWLDNLHMLVSKLGPEIEPDLFSMTADEALGLYRHLRRREAAEVAQRGAES